MKLRTITSLSIGIAALLAAFSTQAQLTNPLGRAPLHKGWIPAATLTNPRGPGFTPMQSCAYNFTTGTNATYLNFCVTANGTLWNFQSPYGAEMLDQNGSYEGYGIWDNVTNVAYYDYLFAVAQDGTPSAAWNSPTTLSSTTTSVKIKRVTADGLWTLTQTITIEAGPPPYAKIEMTLKNNSSVLKVPYLLRYANFLNDNAADSGQFVENYDASSTSAWGYNSYLDEISDGGSEYGLMLQNAAAPTPSSADTGWLAFPQNVEQGPDPANAFLYDYAYVGTLIDTEGSGVLIYRPGNGLAAGKSMTVTVRYVGF